MDDIDNSGVSHAGNVNNNNNNNNEIRRQSIQAAIAKAKELRALHSALMQSSNNNSPAKMRRSSNGFIASPVSSSHALHYFSAQDYPVFTPSYEEDPLPGYHQIMMENNRNYAESWGEHNLLGSSNIEESFCSDYRTTNTASSRKGATMPSELTNFEGHICPLDDRHSITSSYALRSSSPVPNSYSKSRRNSLGDANSVSSCNKCKPAVIRASGEPESANKNAKKSNTIVPLTDSHASNNPLPRNRGLGFSRLFPRLKKKSKNEDSPARSQSDRDALVSVETLKRELTEANESRDLALAEVAEMKSSLGELSRKLESLERYCEELKKALRQAVQPDANPRPEEKLSKIPIDSSIGGEHSIPVSEEVMVEGFLQIVSEARLSMKQLCKILLGHVDEADRTNLNALLQPHKLSLGPKHSKPVLYHLEAIVSQSLYQDFENCAFRRSGPSKVLNPNQDRLERFQSFVALRNLSWNEVLSKGTKYYSEEFGGFCDQKMSGVITALGWTKPWPEHMLQAFFVAAKCVWLLHLLAFSFDPPLAILRVDENAPFESNYMEDVFGDRQRSSNGPIRVRVMVMPGFYVLDRVLKCKVICRYYKPVS